MYVVDSNILINLLGGDENVERWLKNRQEEPIYPVISIVTKIEVLSFNELQDSDLQEAIRLLETFEIINLGEEIADLAASLRRELHLSLADSIVLGTASRLRATLVTNDKVLSKKAVSFVPTLSI